MGEPFNRFSNHIKQADDDAPPIRHIAFGVSGLARPDRKMLQLRTK